MMLTRTSRCFWHLPVKACLLLSLAGPMQLQAQPTQVLAESQVPTYTLPDPLVLENGVRVSTARQWYRQRRPEILELAERQMYGLSPRRPAKMTFRVFDEDSHALGGKATRRQVRVSFNGDANGPGMDLLIYVPNQVKGKVPAILGINFWGNHTIHPDSGIRLTTTWVENNKTPWNNLSCATNHQATEACRGVNAAMWPVEKILDRGFALVTFYREEVAAENTPDRLKTGVHAVFPELQSRQDNFGTIAAWAWGLSRALDYLETDKNIDGQRVALFGWSRLGKAALWAGARDARFAAVISHQSGAGGAALSKRKYGEDVERLNRVFPHWYAANFRQYSHNEEALPFDQHQVIALVAPRPVYIGSAIDDKGADPLGEFLAAKAADPVYRLLGTEGLPGQDFPPLHQPITGRISYHVRAGNHDVLPYDWDQYLHFADRFLKKKK